MGTDPVSQKTHAAPEDGSSIRLPALPEIQHPIVLGLKIGVHSRPAALIVKATTFFFGADLDAALITRHGETVRAASVMGVMMLAAGPSSTLHFTVRAPEEIARKYLGNLERLLAAEWPEHDIGDDCACGGHHTCASAIEADFADYVAKDADGVERAVDKGKTIILINK